MTRRIERILALSAVGAATVCLGRYLRQRSLPGFAGQTVVITGGARGLGLELARRFAWEGASVAICSRSQREIDAALEELRQYHRRVMGEVCDVTDRRQVESFLKHVAERSGAVDVLVNNAGIIQAGPVECMTIDDYRRAMETHFWGPLYAIRAVVPEMKRRGHGRIINIASVGGKISVPHLNPYCASKFALVGLSDGMRTELRKQGIIVTTVCPGMMRTGSPRNAEFKGRYPAEYAWFSISASLPVASIGSARAARRIIEASRAGHAETLLSVPVSIAVRAHALCRTVSTWMLERADRWLPGATPSADGRKGWESTSSWSPSWVTTLNERAAIRNHETLSTSATSTHSASLPRDCLDS